MSGGGERPDGYEAYVTFFKDGEEALALNCEVADTAAERYAGYQNREQPALDEGMLFVFDEPREATFVMHNVDFPLDIVFVAENGTVIKVANAEVEEPGTTETNMTRYDSGGDVKWVVEMNAGLSQANGIAPGTKINIEYPEVLV